MSESIIKCEGLNKWYGSIQALKDVSIDIKKGDLLTDKNIAIKRPGTGISPMNIGEYINKRATKNYFKDELID